jgi:hypothetical protein
MPVLLRRSTVVVLASAVTLLACGGAGSKYAGTWKRDLSGEGQVEMKLASDGKVELMLPSPRWPDSVDMQGKATFKGDTLVFPADTAGASCQKEPAEYVLSRNNDQLEVAGVGMDGCGNRRAGMVGSWTKS